MVERKVSSLLMFSSHVFAVSFQTTGSYFIVLIKNFSEIFQPLLIARVVASKRQSHKGYN